MNQYFNSSFGIMCIFIKLKTIKFQFQGIDSVF